MSSSFYGWQHHALAGSVLSKLNNKYLFMLVPLPKNILILFLLGTLFTLSRPLQKFPLLQNFLWPSYVFFSSILCSDLRRVNCYGFWAPLSMESLVRALGINSLSISAYFFSTSFLCVPAWGVWLPFPTSSLCEREVFPDLGEVEGPSLGDDQGHANVRDDCHLLVSIPSYPCPTSETSRCIPRMRWGSSMRTEIS